MIKASWEKGKKWLEIARRKVNKARTGIPTKYLRRPWPSGNKIRNH
ncbi:MAG: hypothetical protein Q7S45_01645 [Candidatus Curtissbacteria bacterium]|nr:hypothetical protein [Candidatus Curtissbacteria bacterium]